MERLIYGRLLAGQYLLKTKQKSNGRDKRSARVSRRIFRARHSQCLLQQAWNWTGTGLEQDWNTQVPIDPISTPLFMRLTALHVSLLSSRPGLA